MILVHHKEFMIYSTVQFEVDPHIHTVLSGHSWSSLSDYVQHAPIRGIKGFCIAEHGPDTPGGPPDFTPQSQLMLPEFHKGIRMYKGLEADILDFNGTLGTSSKYLKMLEFCIASVHSFCLKGGTREEYNQAYAAVLKNPYVDMIGHPDDPRVPCDLESLVLETKHNSKIIELNNKSLTPLRKNSSENTYQMISLCKKHNVRICVSSDSHWHEMMGDFSLALELLDDLHFPIELVVNRTLESFQQYIVEREKRVL